LYLKLNLNKLATPIGVFSVVYSTILCTLLCKNYFHSHNPATLHFFLSVERQSSPSSLS